MIVKNAKRIILILLAIMLTIFFAVSLVKVFNKYSTPNNDVEAAIFSGGIGTYDDPYQISKPEDLQNFSASVASGRTYYGNYIELTNNIYMYGEEFLPIGLTKGEQYYNHILKPFRGNFNGNNFTIYDLTMSEIPVAKITYMHHIQGVYFSDAGIGMFGAIANGAVIENLILENATFKAGYVDTGMNTVAHGGIVGMYYSWSEETNSKATIQNCGVKNLKFENTTKYDSSYFKTHALAGIIGDKSGYVGDLQVINCYAEGISYSRMIISNKIAWIGPAWCINYGSTKVLNCVGAKKSSGNDFIIAYKVYACTITNCKTTANDVTGLDYSAEGGPNEELSTWYYFESVNDGYPILRSMMQWYQYPIYIWGQGSITIDGNEPPGTNEGMPSIYLPKDYINSVGWPSLSGSTNPGYALGQQIEAIPDENWEFKRWWNADIYNQYYVCEFIQPEYDITFKKPLNEDGNVVDDVEMRIDGETVTESQTFTVLKGPSLNASHQNGTGALTLKYTFKDRIGTEHEFVYEITEKYNLVNSNYQSPIESDMEIIPLLEVKTLTITCITEVDNCVKWIDGSQSTTTTPLTTTLKYGSNLLCQIDTENNRVTIIGGELLISYGPDDNCAFKNLKINNTTYTTYSGYITVTTDLIFEPNYAEKILVTFLEIPNATLNAITNHVYVNDGDSIRGVYDGYPSKTLVYKCGNSTLATYTLDDWYIVTNSNDAINIQEYTEIEPTIEFYACEVTMGTIASSVGTRSITGDSYGTANDGVFVVEYGTTVEFATPTQSEGKFTYTYIFTYAGEEIARIVYTITDDEYAMSSEITEEGREWLTEISETHKIEDDITKEKYGIEMSIEPTFELKEYGGNVE